jgi:hypothetical protein
MSITIPPPVGSDNAFEDFSFDLSDGSTTNSFQHGLIPSDAVSSAATLLPKSEFYDAEIGIANAAWGRIASFAAFLISSGREQQLLRRNAWNDYGSKEIWF